MFLAKLTETAFAQLVWGPPVGRVIAEQNRCEHMLWKSPEILPSTSAWALAKLRLFLLCQRSYYN